MLNSKLMRVTPGNIEKINGELSKGNIFNVNFTKDEKNRLYIYFQCVEHEE
jgi:hypothetical protein